MSFVDARAQYRRAEAGAAVALDNPHQIIQVTLRELEKSLIVLSHAVAQGHALPDSHMNRAFTAIYILQSSLDFEQGGEIATNLFQVYEYCRLKVVAAFRRDPDASLTQAANYISDILQAWDSIAPR
ncbi:MAG: flagellar biosynthesis protein FliS [Rhodobacterales bacterium RIFCSPHIGHO2_02_FULL_62_130]|jgi:flagellar protein FliS|nr:MAG: flagellar biosynthesis protein FliS [Rhodobacterales bacterium RIFCSPHIGHO2_02_FULL_62_130]OHC55955.1 MAG: flagellar biosynthesis protein FliS [Rhodobacterales bacterium RIFCSPHIGHO2_12_FULL_62_75]HCY99948.1 flagellar biosynthesis protein FliS [Rhodobacter sp.]